ncbi:MAG: hypothetical protein RMN25_09075 [Anaerolineae bacterium]|nr:hypothetical protein [Thermoflexales bacterium]MDW8407926.1 hypothetical protein [Anaerolineae bacterium]
MLKCWGRNFYGQLGTGNLIGSVVPTDVAGLGGGIVAVAAGGEHTCALNHSGGVQCWGLNDRGQLGDGTNTNRSVPTNVSGLGGPAIAIAAGYKHTCALLTDGRVQCWGANNRGQLGIASLTHQANPRTVMFYSTRLPFVGINMAE